MKFLLKAVFVLSISFSSIQAQEINKSVDWLTNLSEAKSIAKKEKKHILLYFTGSDWCAPCKMLKEDFFDSEAFKAISSSFVLVMIDYPRRIDILSEEQLAYNKTIVLKYNESKTFPNLMMLTSKGKVLDNISGYSMLRDTSNHFAFVNKYSSK